MTVKEILNDKYMRTMKNMTANRLAFVNAQPCPIQYVYMGLEITVNDIKANGGYNGELWQEISEMQKAKLMASNAHRQYSGQVTKYWLTKREWNYINKNHVIC